MVCLPLVERLAGNVLAELEQEIALNITPTEFASRATATIPASTARNILSGLGYSISSSLPGVDSVTSALEALDRPTPEAIERFVGEAMGP